MESVAKEKMEFHVEIMSKEEGGLRGRTGHSIAVKLTTETG